jgi:hypothetical protein
MDLDSDVEFDDEWEDVPHADLQQAAGATAQSGGITIFLGMLGMRVIND